MNGTHNVPVVSNKRPAEEGKLPKSRDNLKEQWTVMTVAIVAIAVVMGFFVHGISPDIESEITAGDMLSYIGAILSTLATAVMAITTVHLSKQANEIADKQAKIEESVQKLDLQPFAFVTSVRAENISGAPENQPGRLAYCLCSGNGTNDYEIYWLDFVNSTASFLTMQFQGYVDEDGRVERVKTSNSFKPWLTLLPGETATIGLYAIPDFWKRCDNNKPFSIKINLENRLAEKYEETVILGLNHKVKGSGSLRGCI